MEEFKVDLKARELYLQYDLTFSDSPTNEGWIMISYDNNTVRFRPNGLFDFLDVYDSRDSAPVTLYEDRPNGVNQYFTLDAKNKSIMWSTKKLKLGSSEGKLCKFRGRGSQTNAVTLLTVDVRVPHVFRGGSYNVLVWARGVTGYEDELTFSDKTYRSFLTHRKKMINQALSLGDLWMLQEVTQDMLEYPGFLPHGYAYVFRNKHRDIDGSAIVYNGAILSLDNDVDVLHKPLAKTGTQIALAAVMKHTGSGKRFCVSSVHLKSGYADFENLRNTQLHSQLTKIARWRRANNLNLLPTIIAGDFNSDGTREWSTVQESMDKLGWSELETKETCTYNHWHPSKFDYVFSAGSVELTNGKVACGDGSVAPNKSQGSDHFPVCFDVTLL